MAESKIEATINEIEDYIDSCKFKPLSSTVILVNKEEIEELLHDLRRNTPEEIAHYRKIITNKQAILDDARAKADQLIQETTIKTHELINEHEIMEQAYAKANEIVQMATRQAQEILDNAMVQANAYKSQAIQYTDDTLGSMEQILEGAMSEASAHYNALLDSLNGYNEVIKANRAQLYPAMEDLGVSDASGDDVSSEEDLLSAVDDLS